MNEMKFKIALRDGFHQMMNIKDDYIMLKNGNLNPQLVLRYIIVQLQVLSPFAPHLCDYYWRKHLYPTVQGLSNHFEISSSVVTS